MESKLEIQLPDEPINRGLFETTFTHQKMLSILSFHKLLGQPGPELELSIEDSIKALIECMAFFCDRIPSYLKYSYGSEEPLDVTYEKLQAFLCFYRTLVLSSEVNEQFNGIIFPFWESYQVAHESNSWFSLDVLEGESQDSSKPILITNPSTLDLFVSNFCRQARHVFMEEIKRQGADDNDIAKATAKGVPVAIIATLGLPPLAIVYTVVALPFSLLTSAIRKELGLWNTIRVALPESFKAGPKYAIGKRKKAVSKKKERERREKEINQDTSVGLSEQYSISPQKPEHLIPKSVLMEYIIAACRKKAQHGMVSEEHMLSFNSAEIEVALKGRAMADLISNAIINADTEVMIQTYVWERDTPFIAKINSALQEVLARKREAQDNGEEVSPLKVYVVIDERGMAANLAMTGKPGRKWPCDPESLGLFHEEGMVEVHTATFLHLSAGGSHAKYVVIDNQVLIITGANFQSSNFGEQPAYDAAVKIRGPIALAARESFLKIWSDSHTQKQSCSEQVSPPDKLMTDIPAIDARLVPMLFATRKPSRSGSIIENPQNKAFLTAIDQARATIRIATPNLNSPEIIKALIRFVQRKGKLELLLGKGFNDKRESLPGAGGTNESTVKTLLAALNEHQANCDIRWFSLDGETALIGNVAGAAHMKFMEIDGQVVIYGNANLDNISARHLFECNVVIDDAELALYLTEILFIPAFSHAIPATLDGIEKRAAIGAKQNLELIEKHHEGKVYQTLVLTKPQGWRSQPGQYCELQSGNPLGVLFKNNISLAIASGFDDDTVLLTGRTRDLSLHLASFPKKKASEFIKFIGPIGTSFPVELAIDRPVIIIGGGSGITVLRSIVHSLPEQTELHFIYSEKTAADILYRNEVEIWRSKPNHYFTLTRESHDDFHHGRFSDYLEQFELPENPLVFICGPEELVRDTAKRMHDRGVALGDIYGSLSKSASEGGPVFCADHEMLLGEVTAVTQQTRLI